MKKCKWHFAGKRAEDLLKPDPISHLSAGSTVIKSSAVREVRKADNFFFKIDKRKNHSFRREFSRALALQKRGIAVVEHLACGSCENGNCLITLSLDDAVTVEEYLARGVPEDDFLNKLTDFLKLMIYKKIVHKDLHSGNILYVEKTGTFCLVDVRDAYPVSWYNFFLSSAYPMREMIAELSGWLPAEKVCRCLRRLEVKEPEKFLTRILEKKAGFINREWSRRREQILSGYPKFTRKEEDLLFARGAVLSDLEHAEKIPADESIFAASFYLDMVHIPHRKVFAWSAKEQCIWAEPLQMKNADSALVAEQRKRALLFGVNSSCSDWAADASGLVKLSFWKGK